MFFFFQKFGKFLLVGIVFISRNSTNFVFFFAWRYCFCFNSVLSILNLLFVCLLDDYEYNLWKLGVIFSDQAFLYIFFYFLFSIAGNFSRFFFAIHLMDIAFGNKDLSAILRSVTHNGKQVGGGRIGVRSVFRQPRIQTRQSLDKYCMNQSESR